MSNIRYALGDAQEQRLPLKLLYVTSSVYEGDWASIRHSHPFAELFYVRRGRGNFVVGNFLFPVEQDDLVIVNPDARHTEVSVGAEPLEYIVLGIEGLFFHFAGENAEHAVCHLHDQREETLFFLDTMLREIQSMAPSYEVVCQALFEVLLVRLTRNLRGTKPLAEAPRPNNDCGPIKRFIESNYASDITLDSLATLAHLSKFYLVHSFKKSFGMSPINYLFTVRIRASKELLESTDYSIGQIAQSTGFSSQSYFSQSFRRACGVTPGDYRHRAKNQEPLILSLGNLGNDVI